MLTDEDVSKIRSALKTEIDLGLTNKLGLESGQTLDDKLSHLPSKDEFYVENDKLMVELKAIREEQAVITHQYGEIKTRLDKTKTYSAN